MSGWQGSVSGGEGLNFAGRGGRTPGGDCGMIRFGFSGGIEDMVSTHSGQGPIVSERFPTKS